MMIEVKTVTHPVGRGDGTIAKYLNDGWTIASETVNSIPNEFYKGWRSEPEYIQMQTIRFVREIKEQDETG